MKTFQIVTSNANQLSATHYSESAHQKIIIITAATGVPQGYYHKFASHVQSRGYDAVTFDYSGIGQSGNHHTKTQMSDWGRYDLDAVIQWCSERYSSIFLLGHSVGGQIFPFVSQPDLVSAAYFVASQSAFWKHWEGLERLKVLWFWYFNVPVLTRLYGYLPNWGMKSNGEHLPSPVAREWMAWGRHPEGVLQGLQDRRMLIDRIKIPMKFVSLADDHTLAPVNAVKELMKQYSNALSSHEHIIPAAIGLKRIGHFGFFKEKMKDKLWHMPIEFFDQNL